LLDREFRCCGRGCCPTPAETGSTEHNTADATVVAAARHRPDVEITGLGAVAISHLEQVSDHHLAGIRHHIKVGRLPRPGLAGS
jgi:hypothetical protein